MWRAFPPHAAVKTHWPWRPDTKNWQQIFSAVQLVPAIILLY